MDTRIKRSKTSEPCFNLKIITSKKYDNMLNPTKYFDTLSQFIYPKIVEEKNVGKNVALISYLPYPFHVIAI